MKPVLFVYALMNFKIFEDTLMEKSETKFLFASMKLISNSKNVFSNLFREPYSGSLALRMLIQESAYDPENCSGIVSKNCREEKLDGNSDAASATISRSK
jgi:hypothetical protein